MATAETGSKFRTASLYVGDLSPDVTEEILYEKFNAVGRVLSVRVCRDMLTKRSLGYAYVNFQHADDAELALNNMNYSLIKGRPCRIMWSQRDPSLRYSNVGNIFIKNLDCSIDSDSLHDTFSMFGNILSCKVVLNQGKGSSKGCGFVHFDKQESADLAIQTVNGKLLKGTKVYVGKFIPKSERYTNVYVKNLGEDLDQDKLKAVFGKYGSISSVKVLSNENGECQGCGMVNFKSHDAAAKAVKELNGSTIDDCTIYCGRAQNKEERQMELMHKHKSAKLQCYSSCNGMNLYIKNLEAEVDEEKLKTEFSKYGKITSAKVMRHENGRSKGFGFVCFSSPEEANKARTAMNGAVIISKPLYVSLAQNKEERAALQMHRIARGMPQNRPFVPGGMGLRQQQCYTQPYPMGTQMQPVARGMPQNPPYVPGGMWPRTQMQSVACGMPWSGPHVPGGMVLGQQQRNMQPQQMRPQMQFGAPQSQAQTHPQPMYPRVQANAQPGEQT